MAELRSALRGEMAELRTELRGEMVELRQGLACCATKQDLEIWGHALRAELFTQLAGLGDRIALQLSGELARHARASHEASLAEVRVVDEKYADLPGRVATLEQARTKT
jgi:hypothetical protein